MYEIRCIVGDKKLKEVLVFLHNNNTLEYPVIIPLGNDGHSQPQNGNATQTVQEPTKPKAPVQKLKKPKLSAKQRKSPLQPGGKHLKGQGATAVVRNLIERTGVTHITARDMIQATMATGYSKGAYSHAIKLLLADKTVRRGSEIGVYVINKPTQKTVTQHKEGAVEVGIV